MKQYLIYAWDGKDEQALERRMSARPSHFDGAKQLKSSNNFVTGGAILDDDGKMIGSMMVVQFETEEEFRQWMDNEPYIVGNVWKDVTIHPFRMANV